MTVHRARASGELHDLPARQGAELARDPLARRSVGGDGSPRTRWRRPARRNAAEAGRHVARGRPPGIGTATLTHLAHPVLLLRVRVT